MVRDRLLGEESRGCVDTGEGLWDPDLKGGSVRDSYDCGGYVSRRCLEVSL